MRTPEGKICAIYLNLDRKLFEKSIEVARAYNINVRVEEVVLNINGEVFETTYDEFRRALLRLKLIPANK